VGDLVAVHLRPTSGDICSHDSTEANPRRETQLRFTLGQPWVGDTVMTRPRPTSTGDAIPIRLRPTLRERRSLGSPMANIGRETRSRFNQGQPRARDVVEACSRLTPDEQRIVGSPKGVSGYALEGAQLCRPTLQADRSTKYVDQHYKTNRPTNSPTTNSLSSNLMRQRSKSSTTDP
jgi:hypothetical protein